MNDHRGFAIETDYVKCHRLKTENTFLKVNPSIPDKLIEKYVIKNLKFEFTT